jgi:hypothetical protein
MEQPRPDETLRDFLDRRESDLAQQVRELRRQLAPKENELADIRRTKESLGPRPSSLFLDAAELSINLGQLGRAAAADNRQEVVRSLARTIRNTPPQELKLKELIVRAFVEHLRQGTPAELATCISRAYGREIVPGSIRPNLGRLREDGILVQGVAGTWTIEPSVKALIAAAYQDEALLDTARELAWTAEDDDACRQYQANERAGIPQDDRQTWAAKRAEEKLRK